ncbi:MAG: hypothetical protein N2440_06600 [Actinobacteria bacterium]|nr:hypothetical protein [Actinomycetota bacterium]
MLTTFVFVYIAIGLRYLRFESIVKASKKKDRYLVVKRIYQSLYASMLLSTFSCFYFVFMFVKERNIYFAIWLEIILVFIFFFSVPSINQIEDLLSFSEITILSEDNNGGRGGI